MLTPKTNIVFVQGRTQTMKSQTTFDALKEAVVTPPVLASSNFIKPFVVQTDACDIDIGVVLQQDGHPICIPEQSIWVKVSRVVHLRKIVHGHLACCRPMALLPADGRVRYPHRPKEFGPL